MYCTNCGKELPEQAKFCPNCGVNVATITVENPTVEVEEEPKKEPKVWGIFAKIGFGLGLGGLISSCIPVFWIFIMGMEISGFGLVFSILGGRSNEFGYKAKKGRKLSIAGLIVSSVYLILIIVFIILVALGTIDGSTGSYNDGVIYY